MRKKLLTLLFIALSFTMSYGQIAPSGSGTEADPYQIATLDNLVWLAQADSVTWADSSYFLQTADIDASATDTMVIGGFNPGWSPIGNVLAVFKGTYDGGGFTIDGLTSHGITGRMGLFGETDGITVKNLGLTNINMPSGAYSGGLIGHAVGNVTVENSSVTGNLSSTGTCGGMIGEITGSDTIVVSITDSYTDVTIINTGIGDYTFIGGLIGNIAGVSGIISNCYAEGDVTASADADAKIFTGGFVGLFDGNGMTMTECYATGNVIGVVVRNGFAPAGGFGAAIYHNNAINGSYSTGNVSNSGDDTGGFIGYVKYADAVVSNCYSLGDVTRATASTQVRYGAFCGRNRDGGFIEKSYSVGKVMFEGVDDPTGIGFIGYTNAVDTLCFFDKETSLQDSTAGSAVAKTTAEMQTEATFTDWDFVSTWEIDGNYPNLINNSNPDLLPVPVFAGSGTEADPYQISTLDDLVALAQHEEFWDVGAYFAQTSDIDASATDTMFIGGFNPGWSGIGSATTSFTGFYDGAGFEIDGLAVNNNKPNGGLFASVHIFEVKDLGLTNIDMSVGGSSGALIGYADSNLVVTNCYATGEMVGNSNWTGGLIGFIKNANYTITESHTDVNVLNDGVGDNKFAAGFIGYIETTGDYIGKIENCYSTGNVSLTDQAGKAFAGGFIGGVYAIDAPTWSEINKCYSTGDVIGAIGYDGYAPAGGFIGYLYWNFKVSECYATGNVINKGKNGGGFVAYMKYASIVENCYSLGDVTRVEGSTQPNYGGFVGYQRENAGGASIIKSCYSIGKVSGIDGNNGFIGTVDGANSVDTLCYWDAEASGQDSTAGSAVAKTTAEMQTEATYTDWDFATVWEIDGNYPNLMNNSNPDLIPDPLFAGSGTEEDPYQIGTLDDLVALAKNDQYWADSSYFLQTADIDASATDTMVIGGFNPGWSPIGNANISFKGTYNGSGYSIDGLTSHGNSANMGLFGITNGLTVKNLGLTNANISAGGSSGVLVGNAYEDLIIDNCYATGNLEITGTFSGGLIGFIKDSRFDITNSYTDLNVLNVGTGSCYAGGFIGYIELYGDNDFGGKIEDCYSLGDVSLTDSSASGIAGGFIGRVYAAEEHTAWSSIKRCYAAGNVTGAIAADAFGPSGGFIGYLAWRFNVEECYSTGNVTNMGKDTGGFVGYLKYEAEVKNCYSLGDVIRTGGSQPNFGGFVGMQNSWTNSDGKTYYNSIESCYSAGAVTGVDVNGYGFSGSLKAGCLDTLNYYDAEASVQDSTVGNAIGKTTVEMQTQSTFVDWDFTNVWQIEGGSYPTLKATPVSVEDDAISELPSSYSLEQNYPNPFNPTTVISFSLPKASNVQLSVYNIIGEKVAELVNGNMVAGNHTVNFNASNLASGMYIYRIQAGNFVSVKKMMLLK